MLETQAGFELKGDFQPHVATAIILCMSELSHEKSDSGFGLQVVGSVIQPLIHFTKIPLHECNSSFTRK